jgi:hypothetical protein
VKYVLLLVSDSKKPIAIGLGPIAKGQFFVIEYILLKRYIIIQGNHIEKHSYKRYKFLMQLKLLIILKYIFCSRQDYLRPAMKPFCVQAAIG